MRPLTAAALLPVPGDGSASTSWVRALAASASDADRRLLLWFKGEDRKKGKAEAQEDGSIMECRNDEIIAIHTPPPFFQTCPPPPPPPTPC